MEIVIVYYHTLGRTIKLVKILCIKFLEINLNVYLKINIFIVCDYILIKLIYCVLINHIIVSYLKVKLISKNGFEIVNLVVVRWYMGIGAQNTWKTCHCK